MYLSSKLFSILINNTDNELENMLIKFPSNIQFGGVRGMLRERIKIKILRSWRHGLKEWDKFTQKRHKLPHQDRNQ